MKSSKKKKNVLKKKPKPLIKGDNSVALKKPKIDDSSLEKEIKPTSNLKKVVKKKLKIKPKTKPEISFEKTILADSTSHNKSEQQLPQSPPLEISKKVNDSFLRFASLSLKDQFQVVLKKIHTFFKPKNNLTLEEIKAVKLQQSLLRAEQDWQFSRILITFAFLIIAVSVFTYLSLVNFFSPIQQDFSTQINIVKVEKIFSNSSSIKTEELDSSLEANLKPENLLRYQVTAVEGDFFVIGKASHLAIRLREGLQCKIKYRLTPKNNIKSNPKTNLSSNPSSNLISSIPDGSSSNLNSNPNLPTQKSSQSQEQLSKPETKVDNQLENKTTSPTLKSSNLTTSSKSQTSRIEQYISRFLNLFESKSSKPSEFENEIFSVENCIPSESKTTLNPSIVLKQTP
jgi:hypothetical protein